MLEIAVLSAIRVQKIFQTMLEFELEFTIQLFKCDKFRRYDNEREKERTKKIQLLPLFNAKLSRKLATAKNNRLIERHEEECETIKMKILENIF